MKWGASSAGGAGGSALAVVLFLSIVGTGAATVVGASGMYARRALEGIEVRRRLELAIAEAIAVLADDPTPGSDAPSDPVWQALAAFEPAVTLEDVSSRINPNTVCADLLECTEIGALLFTHHYSYPSDALRQHRKEAGLSTAVRTHYAELFREQAFDELITGYGWANINVTDEFALRLICARRTDQDGVTARFCTTPPEALEVERVHTTSPEALEAERVISPEELRGFLGADFEVLYPAVNAQPLWNVHFLPAQILTEVLACPSLGVGDPAGSAAQILSLRDAGEISQEGLYTMTGLEAKSRLHQYLGVRTWFFRLTAEESGARLQVVVARIPGGDSRFQVVERRFSRGES
jgi:hypothetical protein